MRVEVTLRAGQRGRKRLVEEYGSRLLAVRYRTDRSRGEGVKTVELVVHGWRLSRWRKEDPDALLLVRIGYDEVALRQAVRRVQGVWNPIRRGWELRRCLVVQLGIEDRVIGEVERGGDSNEVTTGINMAISTFIARTVSIDGYRALDLETSFQQQ